MQTIVTCPPALHLVWVRNTRAIISMLVITPTLHLPPPPLLRLASPRTHLPTLHHHGKLRTSCHSGLCEAYNRILNPTGPTHGTHIILAWLNVRYVYYICIVLATVMSNSLPIDIVEQEEKVVNETKTELLKIRIKIFYFRPLRPIERTQ